MTTFRKFTAVLLSLLMAMPTAAIAEETPAPTPSVQPTVLPSASPSAEPTASAAPTASAEASPTPTASAEPTASPSASAEASADPTAEPTPSASADVPTLQVYQADDAADMAAAVSTLDDSSENRIVVTTDQALTDISASGSAVYYDGTYVVSFDNASEKDAAVAQIEEKVDASAVIDDTEVSICEGETPAPTEKPSEIADQISTETKQNAEEGLTLREKADQAGKKLVAVIDTGVNGIAEAGVNLTSDPDGDANGHGTRMAQYVLDASENQAMILSIKAIGDNGKGTTSNVYAAVKYAIEARAEIINLSISARDSAETGALKELIASAIQQGIIVVASAGNDSADASGYVPAVIDGVLTAGSCDAAGNIKSFSNYGSAVDYLAVSDSTSEAAAKLSGWTAAGKTENNAELFRTDAAGNAVKPAAPTSESSEWKTNATYVLNSGAIFNGAIKDLAGNVHGSNDGTIDTTIKSIKFYTSSTANPSVTNLRYTTVGDGVTAYWNDSTHSIYVISSGSSVYSATTMEFMFRNLQALESVDVTNLDTSKTTVMTSAFENCYSIKSLNLSSLNTDNVLYMASMFSGCHILESITFSPEMTTGSLTTTASMFFQCYALTALDLSKFNTSKVDNMNSMFFGCKSLTSLDLSSFNTSSVTNMFDMFDSCIKLTSLTFGTGFNTSNVTNMSNMFSGCTLLSSIDLRVLNTTNVTNMSSMFDGCSGLTSIDLSVLDTANVTDMGSMFSDCSGLTSLTFGPNFKTLKVTTMESMFSGCTKLGSITFGDGFDTSKVTNMQSMFFNCANLSSVDVSKFNTASVTTMAGMFQNCSLLGSIDLSHFDTSKVTTISSMFADCPHLSSANLSTFDTSSLTNMGSIFWNCSGLSYLDLSFDAGNVTTSSAMFNAAAKPSTIKTPRNLPSTIAQRLGTSLYDHGAIATPNIVSETLVSALPTGDASSHLLTIGNVVSFDGNGGTTPKSIDVLANGTAKLPGSVLAGKQLTGWYSEKSGGTLVGPAGSDYTPTKTITLYAHWVDDINGVTYQQGTADSSTLVPAEQSGSVGTTITLAANDMTKSPTTESQLTVTLNGNGGSVSPASIVSTKTRTYTANGWTKTSGSETQDYKNGASYEIAAGNLILYPCFTQLLGEQSSVALPTPTRTGYTFAGWYTAATGGTKVGDGGASYTPAGNTTLYAQWTMDTYTISYALDGGTNNASNPASYNITTETISLGEPTRTGYTFTGWTGSNGETAQKSVTIPSGSTGPKSYTAHWTANTYTVAYDGNGNTSGSTASSTHTYDVAQALTANGFGRDYTVTYNHNYTGSTDTSANATYAFAGWNTKADGSGTSYADNANVKNLAASGTFNLYAQWTSAAVTLETPSRTGYTFAGWYDAATGGTKVGEGGASYVPSSNITLYAHWTVNNYKVTYANGTATGGTLPSEQSGNYGSSLTLGTNSMAKSSTEESSLTVTLNGNEGSVSPASIVSTKTRTYTANGWTKTSGSETQDYANGTSYKIAAGNLILYPCFTQSLGEQSSVILPTPTRTGYTFVGWYDAAAGGTKVGEGGASYTPAGNTTLYAQWTMDTYAISYVLDGGTNNASNPASYNITTETISLGEPTRTGYTFTGWTGSNGETAQKSVTISSGSTGPKNYTAHWTANTYTVAYDGNGSTSGSTASSTHTYDVAQALTANGFGRAYTVTYNHNYTGSTDTSATAAYAFAGWNTQADGSGTSYADNANVKNLAASGTFNLYAQWTSATVTLETPSRTGYTFAGWYDAATGGTKVGDGGASYTPAGNATLYAQWTPISYRVHFDFNGGTGSMTDETLVYDAKSSLTANAFTRTGYHFTGWSTAETGPVAYTDQQAVSNLIPDPNPDGSSSITLYAQWAEDANVTITYQSADTAMGTVSSASESVAPATGTAAGSTAEAKPGYHFVSWTNQSGVVVSTAAFLKPAQIGGLNVSATYTANFAPNTYTVKFNANGGSEVMADEVMKYGETISLTANAFTRTGYHFTGWSTTETGTVAYTDQQAVSNLIPDPNPDGSSSITLYAQWAEDVNVTITYQSADTAMGTVSSASESVAPVTGTAKGSIAIANPGYHFVSWTDEKGIEVSKYVSYQPAKVNDLNVSATYTANFAPFTYTIKFDGSSGTGTMADQSLTYGVSTKLSKNSFTLTGFSFSSWNTKKDGTGTSYEDAADIAKIALNTVSKDNEIVLYAQWRIDPNTSETRTVIQEGITEVPEELTKIETLNTPAKIDAAMRIKITEAEKAIPTVNIEVHDVRLQFSTDEGKTWIDATKDNFPKEGITFTLPYPKGTNASNFNFVITHMFTTGENAGRTENLSYTKTADGLQVHVNSLSPFAIGYVKKADQPSGSPAAVSQGKPDLWCITYLDCKGNTVSVQWVETGKAPIKPAGYSYPDISNVSAHQDVRPTSCRIDTKYVVPNTADKG